MEIVEKIFLFWGFITLLGTTIGWFRKEKNIRSNAGSKTSARLALFYSFFTIISAYQIIPPHIPNWWAYTVTPMGILIIVLGQGLGIWAAKTLGKNFTSSLQPIAEGTIVTKGPFSICRHPIMLSFLMTWIGTTIAIGSWPMLVGFGLISIIVMRRVAVEEVYLREVYGEIYLSYCGKVSVIVPFQNPNSKDGQAMEEALKKLAQPDWVKVFCSANCCMDKKIM